MLRIHGLARLVDIKAIKEKDEKDNPDYKVFFTVAVSSGSEERKDDFFFCKAVNGTAEYLIRNLIANPEGSKTKYKSRRFVIDGRINTYEKEEVVECEATLTPELVKDVEGVSLAQDLIVACDKTIKSQNTIITITDIEFLDAKETFTAPSSNSTSVKIKTNTIEEKKTPSTIANSINKDINSKGKDFKNTPPDLNEDDTIDCPIP